MDARQASTNRAMPSAMDIHVKGSHAWGQGLLTRPKRREWDVCKSEHLLGQDQGGLGTEQGQTVDGDRGATLLPGHRALQNWS